MIQLMVGARLSHPSVQVHRHVMIQHLHALAVVTSVTPEHVYIPASVMLARAISPGSSSVCAAICAEEHTPRFASCRRHPLPPVKRPFAVIGVGVYGAWRRRARHSNCYVDGLTATAEICQRREIPGRAASRRTFAYGRLTSNICA